MSENINIIDSQSTQEYKDLLQSFEDLELQIPGNVTDNTTDFLLINQQCLAKLEKLMVEENNCSGYFLELCQIHESLIEQRNLLFSLETLPHQTNQIAPSNNNLNQFQSIPNSKVLADIAGLDEVKQVLIESIVYPTKYPHLFTGVRKPWSTILLFGPPGTGKTSIAHAIAAEVNADFYNISSVDLLSKFIGESEKLIHEFFTQIHHNQNRNIILFDEIDALCKTRTSDDSDHNRRVKTQLLTELQNIITQETKTVVICTTNCPWDIDTAFMRRFQRKLFVPLPGVESRKQILSYKAGMVNLSDDEWNLILSHTDGYSGSDLEIVVNFVLYEPLRDLDSCCFWIMTSDGFFIPSTKDEPNAFSSDITSLPAEKIQLRHISFPDFQKALSLIPKSIQLDDLKKYESFK